MIEQHSHFSTIRNEICKNILAIFLKSRNLELDDEGLHALCTVALQSLVKLYRFFTGGKRTHTTCMRESKFEYRTHKFILYVTIHEINYNPLCFLSATTENDFRTTYLTRLVFCFIEANILQENMRWKAFAEIYLMDSFAPCAKFYFSLIIVEIFIASTEQGKV